MASRKTTALKPCLEAVEALCRPLAKKELQSLILKLALEAAPGERAAFLATLTGTKKPRPANAPGSENDLIARIEELQGDILKRADSIEDGSYWDEDEEDDYYSNGDEGPTLVSDEMKAEFAACLAGADELFLAGRLDEARTAYARFFALVKVVEEYDGGCATWGR